MADPGLVVASAVILPEDIPVVDENGHSPKTSTLKRRQSDLDASETDSKKRARVEETVDEHQVENDSVKPSSEANGRPTRLRKGQEEERKRGQRMFGALLGALGQSQGGSSDGRTRRRQPSGTSDQAIQKRMEIEKRTQERLKRMNEEPVSLSKEEEERLQRRKNEVQWDIDEQTMKVHHEHMLASAKYLKTTTEPKLYYRPYKLSVDDEDRIQRQTQDIQDQIDEESLEFGDKRREALRRLEEGADISTDSKHNDMDVEVSNDPDPEAGQVVAEPQQAVVSTTTDQEDASPATGSKDASPPADTSRDYLHHGETVLEGEEDTVIY